MKSVPAIAFEYRPSRWLATLILAITLLALLAIVFCGLNVWRKLFIAMLAMGYSIGAFKAFVRPPFTRIVWHSAGHWRLGGISGDAQIGELKRSVILGPLIVLILRTGARRSIALPLLPDVCDADTRRRLRVRLSRADALGLD